MANGSNGESTLPMVTPQIVEEPETGLVPQAQAQPVAGLFGDQRIFLNAPQYHWHVQGAVGADDEARQHIVALAQRLHQFGHRTEERELELWHQLSNVADVAGVERRLAIAVVHCVQVSLTGTTVALSWACWSMVWGLVGTNTLTL